MKIENKMQSMEYIRKLNLNILPEQYFEIFQESKLKQFIMQHKAPYYSVRIKDKVMSNKHKLAVSYEEVLEYCKDLSHFTLNISSYCYRDNQILVGEIKIDEKMQIEYILSKNPTDSVRDCYKNPDYSGKTDIYDKAFLNIKGINKIIDYILEKELINMIVEFTVFDCLLGKNKKDVVIWEIRTDY